MLLSEMQVISVINQKKKKNIKKGIRLYIIIVHIQHRGDD